MARNLIFGSASSTRMFRTRNSRKLSLGYRVGFDGTSKSSNHLDGIIRAVKKYGTGKTEKYKVTDSED